MTTVRAILIPLDGSDLAECALAAGAGTARRLNAFVHLVRVHTQVPLMAAEVVALSQQTEREVLEEEERYLEGVATRLRSRGLAVSTSVVNGAIVPALKTYIDRHGIGLVVMSSHGLGGIRRAIIGSVTDQLVRSVSVPVLIVNPAMAVRIGEVWPRHILLPLDGSPFAAAAIDALPVVDPLHTAHLSLVTVFQPGYPPMGPWSFQMAPFLDASEQCQDRLRNQLADAAGRLRSDGHKVAAHVLTGGKVARELLEFGTVRDCDLIVMATHGAGGIDRVMFGSVADQVIRHSSLPVLVVRPSVNAALTPTRPGELLAEAGA
jgi:nucleotide-binding universal stress UspA family protein